ncbi:hypothetical protein LSG23_20415 (plasmid) [Bacillus velezensis]|uniref:hypothetical protein n=1 Tax=Bacillus velezensis TaxID=492670 RepID=UPI000987E92B|nr:hypothetical protein [Bacillus velezensis]AQS42431.1 hypothetical protein BVH55_00095 [Bacillus velezensis]WNR83230.1 hypothetical protein RP314_20435 [Bacillus velezensis]
MAAVPKMKESDLFEPVKSFLIKNGCSKVYGEVLGCDVFGINGVCDIVVELKTTLSFKLIDQALDRLNHGHYVYIAVPKRKGHIPRCVKYLLEEKNIGLLEVGKDKYSDDIIVHVSIPAKYNRLATEWKKRGLKSTRDYIKDYHETQMGGVKGGESVTEYSNMIDNIKDFLYRRMRGKWATIEEILNHCETYYSNPKPSLNATLQAKWNSDWCESKVVNRKRYFRIRKEQYYYGEGV